MPTVYLHVGMHKTGTSAFQQFMHDHRHWLLEHGYYVPETGRAKGGAHHSLVRAIAGLPGPPAFVHLPNRLTKEIDESGQPDLIISSETMSQIMRAPELLERFLDFFGALGYSVAFILYIAEEPAAFNSYYTQTVENLRHGDPFETFVTGRLNRIRDFPPLWRILNSRPAVRLIAKPYNTDVRKIGIAKAIIDDLGLDGAAIGASRVNVSPGPITIHLCRWLRRRIDVDEVPPNARQLALGRALIHSVVGHESSKYSGLTDKLVARIESELAGYKAETAQELWGKPWSECFPANAERHYLANDFEIVPPDRETAQIVRLKKTALAREWMTIRNDESLKMAEPSWPARIPDAMRAAGFGIDQLGMIRRNF